MNRKILTYQMRIDAETGEPCRGFLREEEDTLETWQGIVGGYISVLSVAKGIDVILNDNGKIDNLPFNRLFFDGKPLDVLVGSLVCVRHKGEEFSSIREDDIPMIHQYLRPLIKVGSIYMIAQEDMLQDYKGGR